MTASRDREPAPQAPSPTALRQRLANLSPEKLAALQQRLQQQERLGYEPLRTLPDEVAYPLSFHQQRLWFLEQFQPGTPLYNVTRAIRLRGPLNRGALKLTLESLVQRHEALRTTFHVSDGEPVQQINPFSGLQLPFVDLRAASGNRKIVESLLQQRLTDEGRRPFDLTEDLMLRAVLYQVSDDEHILQITIHHLSCDGWSLHLLFNELSVLYRRYCSAQGIELSPTPLRYVDFARWQRKPQQSALFTERIQWWKRQLAGAPQVLELTSDRPRPQFESGSGAFQSLELPSDLLERLTTFSRQENVTLYMTLLTGFFILLHRYTGMEDFLVGSTDAGRQRPETHGVVGFFVDTVALRADLSGNPTARQVLQRVRQTVIDAVNYGDVPFDRIVQSLDLPRDLSRHPLIQVVFNAPPQYALELCDLDVSPVPVDLQISRFDLEMTYADGANRSTGMTWNTDLFNGDTIQRLLGHYAMLLRAVVADPNQPVRQLPLLTEQERHQLLVEWNNTTSEYQSDRCVHQLFEEQGEKTPDAVAVVFEDQKLTYRELNARANQLAHYLRERDVGPEVLVALCMDRSLEMVVGLLAILKAGGAYVPLDPSYPKERLRFMLEDSQAALILTQERLVDMVSEPTLGSTLPALRNRVLCLDRDWAMISQESIENLSVQTTAENLAYVTYTSGSTGQPKGVEVPHRGIIRLVCGADYVQLDSTQVFLQLAPIAFDAATFELWGALLHGAQCVLFPGRQPSPTELGDVLHKHQVNTLWLTASLFNSFIDHAPEILTGVKHLITGGEALSVTHVRRALTRLPETQLLNGYGPTESTTFACTYALPRSIEEAVTSIPIGRPIANTTVYILDPYLNPVLIGVVGELYIGGDGLARGYLKRPELTAEKFIPNPFSLEPGARLYKTGDLARYLPDGTIEFLGRNDHQVKLRGYRIEMGEIETVLSAHPVVQAAVVLVREDTPGDKQLVAYIMTNQSTSPPLSELRFFLKQTLPEYMLPSAFVFLDRLPLTPNGKIDRKVLPAPDQTRPALAEQYVASRTSVEEILTNIWQDILKLERIGVHDNFFDLGGHSLLATQVVARINKQFHLAVPLRALFEWPTIVALATLIAEQQKQVVSVEALDPLLSDIEAMSEEEAEVHLAAETENRQTTS
jgi:amino acid adenylation domain-containing protein